MSFTISQFANNATPSLANLDQNFNAAFLLVPIPCSVSGTNQISLAQNTAGLAATVAITAYVNGLQLCGIAAQTNTGATIATLATLDHLNVYKDSISGPVALVGGEIVQGNAFTLIYDSTLNSNVGGWHLVSGASAVGNTITPALVRASTGLQVGATTTPTLSGLLQATATLTYTALVPNASQDQTFTVAGLLSTDGIAMALPLPASTGIILTPYFAAGNTVTGTVALRASNVTAASTITLGAVTVGMKALRTV